MVLGRNPPSLDPPCTMASTLMDSEHTLHLPNESLVTAESSVLH